MIDLDFFFDISRDVAMATNFGQNLQNDLHSAPWHFKTGCTIVLLMHVFIAPLIALHRVKMVKIVSIVSELKWGRKWKLCWNWTIFVHLAYWHSGSAGPIFAIFSPNESVLDVQGAPIKNSPLGKIHYLSYCNRFFHQIYSFHRATFWLHTQQILL